MTANSTTTSSRCVSGSTRPPPSCQMGGTSPSRYLPCLIDNNVDQPARQAVRRKARQGFSEGLHSCCHLPGSQATVMVAKLDQDEQPCYTEQYGGAQRPAGVAPRS